MRCYPSLSEYKTAALKIEDILALDKAARLGNSKETFRPKACYGTFAHALDKPGVMKRTNSSYGSHMSPTHAKGLDEVAVPKEVILEMLLVSPTEGRIIPHG